jgi:hypothetical protein
MSDKRKAATDHLLKHIQLLDPTGYNTKRYIAMFSSMSDEEFDSYMINLKEKKFKLALYVPNMKIPLKMENLLRAADSLKLELFERLRMIDEVTQKKYLTTNKYLVLKLPVRRARQFLMHKLSVAESDKKLDALTGQVTRPDKASSISFVESQLLYARGLNRVLDEFVKVRGGDIHAFSTFKQQLEETGAARLEYVDPNTVPRSTIVMGVILKCMLLDNNLVEGL